jgi:predicted phosphodiesterase
VARRRLVTRHRFLVRTLQGVALLVVALVVAVPTALSTFVHSERHITIGAHEATVVPSFDGYATIDFGPLLPHVRLPAEAPANLGVDISLGNAQVESLDQLVARDAVIASQPQGEIAAVRSEIIDMGIAAMLRGVGVGLLAALTVGLAWRAIGPRRRSEIWLLLRHATLRRAALATATGAAVVVAGVLIAVPERGQSRPESAWVPLAQVFPEVPSDPVLDRVELVAGSATRSSRALVEGALETYRASVRFYGALAVRAATADVRRPEPGETTAVVVTDRHDNVGMDPVARAIGDRARASILIDLGDDTSNGGSWEKFSINSLAREFDSYDVVSVAGNHDQGSTVVNAMKERGFRVLDGTPVDVDGIRFLGSSDPRSSGFTAGYDGNESDNITAVRDQSEALAEVACEDGEVDVLITHSPSSAKKTVADGCVDLALSGHLHRQVGPSLVTGANGRSVTTMTTASTGGAVYAFALGSKLRRQAQVTVVTFHDGAPVGIQPVSFQPGGIIEVADYTPITPSPR